MAREKVTIEVSGEILDSITENMEIAGYNDKDIMAIRGRALYEGLNKNGALIERADLVKAENTLSYKPVKIRFIDNNPTGHGINLRTRKFDRLVQRIGFINHSYGRLNTNDLTDKEKEENWNKDFEDKLGTYEVIVEIVIWQKEFPNIAKRLRELHEEGNLKFSFEAERDFVETDEGYRKCFNIHFTGIAIVDNPAFPEAKSLMVAEILDKGDNEEMDELKKLIESMNSTIGTEVAEQFNKHLGTLNKTIEDLKDESADLKVEVAEMKGKNTTINSELEDVKVELAEYKDKEELAEKEQLGNERYERLKKYGEPEKTINEIAELTKEEFADLLCEMVDNYSPDEHAGVTGSPLTRKKSDISNKDKILNILI